MRPETLPNTDYFDTPARAERLQLLVHLMRNAATPVYLRGPGGAGKTVFADRLRLALGDDAVVVWVDLTEPVKLVAEVIRQLELSPEAADAWPGSMMQGLGDQQLVVVVDAADQADVQMQQALRGLSDEGARLLLVGHGDGFEGGDVQFVDLPPFEPDESLAFLRKGAGDNIDRITPDLAAASHIAAGGLPGGLLEVLQGLPQREPEIAPSPEPPPTPPPAARPDRNEEPVVEKKRAAPKSPTAEDVMRRNKTNYFAWVGAGVLGLLLVAVLVFQDQINAVLVAPEQVADDPDGTPAPGSPAPELAALAVPSAEPANTDIEQTSSDGIESDIAPGKDLPQLSEARLTPQPQTSEKSPDTDDSPLANEPGGVPVIALPELSPPADSAIEGTELSNDAAGPAQPGVPGESPSSTAQPGEAAADPLDVVAKDALEAAAEPAEPVEDVMPSTAAAELPVVETPDPPVIDKSPKTASKPSVAIEPPLGLAPVDRDVPPEKAGAGPAPVEERSIGVARVPAEQPPVSGASWLDSRPGSRYTLQLVGARERLSIEKFIRDHDISAPFAIFERQLSGKPWFSLVAGDYPDRAAAVAARERLPATLQKGGIWPRTFESVQTAQ